MSNNRYIPSWGVSPTQTNQDPQDDEVASEDEWYSTRPPPPSPPDSPLASPKVQGRPQFDMRDRVYVRNPHSVSPPFITQMELEMLSSPTTTSSGKKGANVTPNSIIKTGQWLDKLSSTKKKKPSQKGNSKKSVPKMKPTSKTPTKKGKTVTKFKIGSVVSSLGVGKLLPLEKGERCRKRERIYGTITKKSNSFEGSWHVKFKNGVKGVFRESQLKFDNNLGLTHRLTSDKSKKISLEKADYISIKEKK